MTSFEDACRKMLGAPDCAVVSTDLSGGEWEGEDPWASRVPIELWVYAYDYENKKRNMYAQSWKRKFDSIPELWEALEEASNDSEV